MGCNGLEIKLCCNCVFAHFFHQDNRSGELEQWKYFCPGCLEWSLLVLSSGVFRRVCRIEYSLFVLRGLEEFHLRRRCHKVCRALKLGLERRYVEEHRQGSIRLLVSELAGFGCVEKSSVLLSRHRHYRCELLSCMQRRQVLGGQRQRL